ncbi:hypothetical protein HOF78_01855 [Candidatus Woesearchaeota archaeon]|jgi:hypothetical protein|nr:hypothetical protein [Candidatus Woesearchaeota archaeon]
MDSANIISKKLKIIDNIICYYETSHKHSWSNISGKVIPFALFMVLICFNMLYLMIDYVKKDFPYSKLSMIIGVILVLISLASINLYSDSHAERKMKALKKCYRLKDCLIKGEVNNLLYGEVINCFKKETDLVKKSQKITIKDLELENNWLKKTFSKKRMKISAKFSAIVGITYWATTVYEKAFADNSMVAGAIGFFTVFFVLLIIGGKILDTMSKD